MDVDTALESIIARGVEATYDWDGATEVHIKNEVISGDGQLKIDVNAIRLRLTISDAASRMPDRVDFLRDVRPGQLVPRERYGSARSTASDRWAAVDVLHRGTSWGDQTTYTFGAGAVTVRGPSHDQPSYYRHVFLGGDIPNATHYTRVGDRSAFDRIDSSFRGKVFSLRRLTDEREPARSVLAAVLNGPLSALEQESLWLALCYVSGTRIKSLYTDSFDALGELVQRSHRIGVDSGLRREKPFIERQTQLNDEGLARLLEGFTALVERGFPIGKAIAHLLDAAGQSIETEIIHLVFSIQVLVSGYRAERMTGADAGKAEPAKVNADDSKSSSEFRSRFRDAQSIGFRRQVLATMKSLGLSPSDGTLYALDLRNELFHTGYLPHDWTTEDLELKQRWFDAPGALRNLANAIILRLVGFDGCFNEATRLGIIDLSQSVVNI